MKKQSESPKQKMLKEHFEWIRVMGEGSFGQVYLIRDKTTKTEYALKQYSRHQLQKTGKYKSLVRSVYILQHLNHENIIRCVNYIVPSGYQAPIYTLFQPCKKGSLDNISKHLRNQKLKTIIKLILFDLAQALTYLKSIRVAHRDLKPSNITFNSEGVLKLIDFDQAVCFDDKNESTLKNKILQQFGFNQTSVFKRTHKARASNFIGTQFYMSPEMIQSTICDQKSDLWAFGCILYELLVGSYLHIEFDEQEVFQSELSSRLHAFACACSDGQALDLFKDIAKYNPQERIDIDQVIKHPYFDEVKDEKKRSVVRKKFIRFLRGNYSIDRDRSYYCIGLNDLELSMGKELHRSLKTVVLVQNAKVFEYYEVISGPFYFKFKHCKNDRDLHFYIPYCRIEHLIRRNDYLEIYFYSDKNDEVIEVKTFKHLYPAMLNNLHQVMEMIIKD